MPYRIIYAIRYWLEPLPTDPPGWLMAITAELYHDGNAHGRNCRPRHKARTIDLRVGDELMCCRRWPTIAKIEVGRDGWLTDEEAAQRTGNYRYCYQPKGETRSVEEIRDAQPQPGHW